MNELFEGVFCCDAALFVEQLGLLVVSDLQLGQEEELRSKGALVIDKEYSSMKKRLFSCLKETGATRILFNGDLKHEFSRINSQERDTLQDLFSSLQDHGVEVVLVKGNHDNMLVPLVKKSGLVLVEYFLEDGFLFCHGHEVPQKEVLSKAHTIIIGHEHPALKIGDGVRFEVIKCFLLGSFQDKKLVIIPSFSEVTQGTDVLTSNGLGPFFERKNSFEVFVLLDDEVLPFGFVKDLRKKLL